MIVVELPLQQLTKSIINQIIDFVNLTWTIYSGRKKWLNRQTSQQHDKQLTERDPEYDEQACNSIRYP
ncbi:hypothetical protein NBRC116587_16310 [Pseudoteredinibacter isoporae]